MRCLWIFRFTRNDRNSYNHSDKTEKPGDEPGFSVYDVLSCDRNHMALMITLSVPLGRMARVVFSSSGW